MTELMNRVIVIVAALLAGLAVIRLLSTNRFTRRWVAAQLTKHGVLPTIRTVLIPVVVVFRIVLSLLAGG
jgi:hypothetical protein